MMEVRTVHAFDDNYIWLIGSRDNPHVAIVDPGDDEPVIERIEADGLQPEAILITHHHGDHTGGAQALAQRYGIPVYGPAGERIPAVSHKLQQGDTVELPGCGLHFSVLDTPGHTRGHICYLGHDALFCGDTLFAGGCGRLFEGTPEQMYLSLEKLRALPDETVVYCAHEYTLANLTFALVAEPENQALQQRMQRVRALRAEGRDTVPSSMADEKQTNPFLRSHVPALVHAAERFAGQPLKEPAEVFATVRRWKDSLD
ncbi:MAG TPA: hydroxyacylglutathione hydrolase [Gammaproteobacteria bacterium]